MSAEAAPLPDDACPGYSHVVTVPWAEWAPHGLMLRWFLEARGVRYACVTCAHTRRPVLYLLRSEADARTVLEGVAMANDPRATHGWWDKPAG